MLQASTPPNRSLRSGSPQRFKQPPYQHRSSHWLPLLLPLVLASPPVHADDLPPLVITATRSATQLDASLAAVTQLERADIERLQPASLPDLLQRLPSVQISRSGGHGQQSSLFLRGTESDHLLVLVDGVRIGSASSGGAALHLIPVNLIERIELVRGPRSSLYGSEAIGGVLQIFTRRGGDALQPELSLTTTSNQLHRIESGVSGRHGSSWFNLQLSAERDRGIDACNNPSVCFSSEPDRDAHHTDAVALRGGYRFSDAVSGELSWLRSDAESDYDGPTQNHSNTRQEVFGGQLELDPGSNWRSRVMIGRSRDKSDDQLNGAAVGYFNTERDSVSLQQEFAIGDHHLLTFGGDWLEDHLQSSTQFSRRERENRALFAQWQGALQRHSWEISLRQDDNQQFGLYQTGHLGWGWRGDDGFHLALQYGRSFKAPTFNDLYWPSEAYGDGATYAYTYVGNPLLQPEQARSVELSISQRYLTGDWSLRIFNSDIDDLILYDADSVFDVPSGLYVTHATMQNMNQAQIRGVELALQQQHQQWYSQIQLTLLNPEDRSSGHQLARRARTTLQIDLDRQQGNWRYGTALLAVGERYDDAANTRRLAPYATVDLRAEQRLNHHWRLQAKLSNLFDAGYESVYGYNQPGRVIALTLRYAATPGSD